MIFPVKRVKEELINEFAVSKMNIDDFSKMHSTQPETLRSWIQDKMYKSQHPENQSPDIFQASEFVELDIPHASKNQITAGGKHMMFDFSNARIFLRPGTTDMRTSKEELLHVINDLWRKTLNR